MSTILLKKMNSPISSKDYYNVKIHIDAELNTKGIPYACIYNMYSLSIFFSVIILLVYLFLVMVKIFILGMTVVFRVNRWHKVNLISKKFSSNLFLYYFLNLF